MPGSRYGAVPAGLVALVERRASAEGRSSPRIGGRVPRGAEKLDLDTLSGRGRRVLEAAGFRTPESLGAFRVELLDAVLSVPDLDEAHRQRVGLAYAGVEGLTAAHRDFLARHRVLPADAPWVLTTCRDRVLVAGADVRIDPAVFERLEHEDPAAALGGRDAGPPWGDGAGPDPPPHLLVDLLADPRDLERAPDAARMAELLALTDDELAAHAGELAVGAQAQAVGGDAALACAAVARLTSLRRGQPDRAVMAQVVAPAIGLVASGRDGARGAGRWLAAEAARVARAAQPGTAAAAVAAARWQRAARAEARAARRAAAAVPANARPARRRAALEAHARIVAAVDEHGAPVSPALTTAGIAALTDVARAVYAAIALPGVSGVLPPGAPPGLAGRFLPSDPTWPLGPGGLTSLTPLDVATGVLDTIGALGAPERCLPLGGDVFRFDWLLGEAREVADDLAHLDDLLVTVLEHLTDALEDVAALTEDVVERIAAIVEQIRRQADAVATQVRTAVGDVVALALRSATLLGVVHWLEQWPMDHWVGIGNAVAGAIGAGTSADDAAMAYVESKMRAGLGRAMAPAIQQFDQLAQTITAELGSFALDPALVGSLANLLAQSGLLPGRDPTAAAQNLLRPIADAATATVTLLTAELAAARKSLEDLRDGVAFPVDVKRLMLAWVAAPFVALLLAAAIAVLSGPFAFTAVPLTATLLLLGLAAVLAAESVVRPIVMRVLAGVLGLSRDLDAQARAGLSTAGGQLAELRRLLATAGSLQAAIDTASMTVTGAVLRLMPPELTALENALLAARDGIRRQLQPVLFALDRAFFRETLIPGAGLGQLELPAPEPSLTGGARLFDALRLTPQLAVLLAHYESKRVLLLPLLGQRQELTHVLSLLDVLGGVAGAPAPPQRLQALLPVRPPAGEQPAAATLPFTLDVSVLDRVAPGVHSQLVKDVAVQIDFEPVADEGGFAALAGRLSEAAGGTFDPALASRATPSSLPGLPIAPLRFPTGVPAVLTQPCGSAVRVPPAVVSLFNGCTIGGSCDTPLPPDERPPSLLNVELRDDPDPGANAAGWRQMVFHDGCASVLFSHFELTRDSLRFVAEPKQLKPFEHRGALGAWQLEVPAAVRRFVAHDLPPVRDVRLVLSTSGQWSEALKDALADREPATTRHTAPAALPATLDELLKAVDSLLGAASLGNLLTLDDLVPKPLPQAAGNAIVATPLLWVGGPAEWVVEEIRSGATVVPAARHVRVARVDVAALGIAGATVAFTPKGGERRATTVGFDTGLATADLARLGAPASPLGTWQLELPALVQAATLTIFTEVAP